MSDVNTLGPTSGLGLDSGPVQHWTVSIGPLLTALFIATGHFLTNWERHVCNWWNLKSTVTQRAILYSACLNAGIDMPSLCDASSFQPVSRTVVSFVDRLVGHIGAWTSAPLLVMLLSCHGAQWIWKTKQKIKESQGSRTYSALYLWQPWWQETLETALQKKHLF